MADASTPLFDQRRERARFPAPIAVALEVLVSELEVSGEETTADETAAAIEATLIHLGRLWVAEYLRAVAQGGLASCAAIQRELLERLASKGALLTGQWVGLARAVREHMGAHPTVVAELRAIDFGARGEEQHPVARLLHFRNHFSHGSFRSSVEQIRVQRLLLHELLARVPALREQPALCRDVESGVVLAASGDWPVVSAPEGAALPAGHPTILGAQGARLDLHPLLVARSEGGQRRLAGFSAQHPAEQLLRHPALEVWAERYAREREGWVEYTGETQAGRLPPEAAAALRARLGSARPGLMLVQGHPGCGAAGAVAAIEESDPLQLGLARYAAVGRVAVREGEVGQSGLSVARMLLRLVERALGMELGSTAASAHDVLAEDGPLRRKLRALEEAGERVLLGIEDLQHGREPYRGEALTVVQLYEALVDTPVDVVATTVPGGLERPLFDERIALAVPEQPEALEVTAWVRRLCSQQPLRTRVLRLVAESERALHLFEVCDALEARDGDKVFEPAVERALWDLRPLLRWSRVEVQHEDGERERARAWSAFSGTLASSIEGVAEQPS